MPIVEIIVKIKLSNGQEIEMTKDVAIKLASDIRSSLGITDTITTWRYLDSEQIPHTRPYPYTPIIPTPIMPDWTLITCIND